MADHKALKAKLESEAVAFRQVQTGEPPRRSSCAPLLTSSLSDIQRAEQARGQCAQQLSENDMVLKASARSRPRLRPKGARREPRPLCVLAPPSHTHAHVQELERLAPEAGVFKLVGPLLVRQDLVEARANVGKRLDFIRHERRVRPRPARGSRLRRSPGPRSGPAADTSPRALPSLQ